MYFYVDETGQTGLNLFDEAQPSLFYGVLSSKNDLDEVTKPYIENIRRTLGVDRLHAAELGNRELAKIASALDTIKRKNGIRFDFYRVAKPDHAAISFFDQVFDQGLNPAVPWTSYWTPLRYILLIKLAHIFDEETLKKSWSARITVNTERANTEFVEVCNTLAARTHIIPDQRSRDIIGDALHWAAKNPEEIHYNVYDKKDALQISPNLIGFQSVLHGIASRLKLEKSEATKIIVDRQSQFNAAQHWIAEVYKKGKHLPFENGPGLPTMDLSHIPTTPISCTPGTESTGLEIVDIYLWIFKRWHEGREIAPQLMKLVEEQFGVGNFDEVSLSGLQRRWGQWFNELPEPTEEELVRAKEIRDIQEKARKPHIDSLRRGE